jgi:hypothetical protein
MHASACGWINIDGVNDAPRRPQYNQTIHGKMKICAAPDTM